MLLKVAHDVLGSNNLVCLFADSSLLPRRESEQALRDINAIGCRLEVVQVDPLQWPEVADNPRKRCYFCKTRMYSIFYRQLAGSGITKLMDGTNLDDLDEDRPGLQAIRELKVRIPLVEAGLAKQEIRLLSRQLQLPNWNRPSASCLATRIATGQPLTGELLAVVAAGEACLEKHGFYGTRVRLDAGRAVIELAANDCSRFCASAARSSLVALLQASGLKQVCLDLQERPRWKSG